MMPRKCVHSGVTTYLWGPRLRTRAHTGRVREVRSPILVGRADQLDTLTAAVERAAAGAGGMVFLLGEAGMGKTRLAAETGELARSSGMAVLPGRATPAATPDPYRPLAEAFLSSWRGRTPPAGAVHEGLRPAAEILVPTWAPARGERRAAPSVLTSVRPPWRCSTVSVARGRCWSSTTCSGATPSRWRCSSISPTRSRTGPS